MASFDLGEFGGVLLGGAAPVVVTSGGGPVKADIVVEWDFDNDDDFDQPEENVTSYVVAAETQTGRDFPSQLSGRAGPGRLQVTLLNEDNRFSYFNSASPLNAGDFSLRIGRKIRIRTSTASGTDPVMVVHERFNRPDGVLGTAETGQDWFFSGGAGTGASWFLIDDERVVAQDSTGTVQAAMINTGLTDYYTQVSISDTLFQFSTSRQGIISRRVDNSNFVEVVLIITGGVFLIEMAETVAGVRSVLDSYPIWPWPGLTLGLQCVGSSLTGYVSGVPVMSGTTAVSSTDDTTGILYKWDNAPPTVAAPTFDSFHVFDGVAGTIDGVIWTGDVTSVQPSLSVGGIKTVTVSAEGPLAKAALTDVVRPRIVKESGTTGEGPHTGLLVGDVLSKANLLLPPGPIDEGDVTIGPIAIDDGKCLDLARQFEVVESGFLYETPEGAIGYQKRSHRAGAASVAAFSDASGAQFGYTELTPLDQRRDIINRVTVGLSPDQVGSIDLTVRTGNTGLGVTNHVDVLLPTVAADDTLLVIIASTVATSGRGWNTPIWWVNHRSFGVQDDDSIRTRIYSHNCDGTESGTTVRFYTNSGTLGGAWIAHVWRVQDWYQADDGGKAFAPPVNGANPPGLVHGWGKVPVTFLAWNAALTSVSGGSFDGDEWRIPEGYGGGGSSTLNGSVDGFDVSLQSVVRFSVDESDNPTTFAGFNGYQINEAGTIAIRGFNGPHVVLPTLKNPTQFQASPGRFVTVDDVASQDELRTIRSNPDQTNLFASEDDAEAYAENLLATFRDDRPIFSLTFVATTNAAYRAQAYRRRVGDLIHLTANGDTGMGVDADFFIESINHRWSDGGTLWTTTWEMSPA